MSQPPAAPYRPPALANANPTAPPAARPVNSELTTILMNIPNLVKMANSGGLTEIQIRQLRQLIRQHTPTILANAQARGLPNPLLNLPAILDPHQPWEGAIANAVIKKPNPTPATTSTAASTPASAPQANLTLAQRQAQASNPGTAAANATQTPAQRPAGAIQLSEQQVRAMINLTPQQRESYFANNPAAKTAFQNYITRLRAHSAQTARTSSAANSASSTPPPTTTSVLPNLAIPANARRDTPSQRAPQTRIEEPRLALVQDEVLARKRRLREMLGDMAHDTDLEVGVAEILKDAADQFMADALHEACRLASHRKSSTVEVKDIALAMDMHHSIQIPGFQALNDQPRPNTSTIDETQRKRARGVFPRRRMALEAVAKAQEEA